MAFKKVTYKLGEESRLNTVEPIRSKTDIINIEKFFDSQNWHKYTVIFRLGIHTGLRISDILGFKVKDVKNKKYVELREQKTGKYKKFVLQPKLQVMLRNWIGDKPDDAWLFEGHINKKLDRSQVYRRMNDAAEALKIPANIGTHTLRKTFGYHFHRQFNDLPLLQEILNHTSPDVTKRYIGITQEEINEKLLQLDLEDPRDILIRLSQFSGRTRTAYKRAVSFCIAYLKSGSTLHAPFARIILDLLQNNIKLEEDEILDEEYINEDFIK